MRTMSSVAAATVVSVVTVFAPSGASATPVVNAVPLIPLTSPIETVVEFSHPVRLDSLAATLADLNVTPTSFSHITKEGTVGGGVSHGMPLSTVVKEYRESYHRVVDQSEPKIWRVSLLGAAPSVTARSLRDDAASVTRSSPRLTNSTFAVPTAPVTPNVNPSQGSPPAPPPPPADAPKVWSPENGRVVTRNESADPRTGRLIENTLTWANQASIDFFGPRAYEHDFKLFNRENFSPEYAGVGTRPVCVPGQGEDFWADRNMVFFDTSFPAEIKPYFDTTALDGCGTRDFTVGIYHPKLLKPGVTYNIKVLPRSGVEDKSPYTLTAQILQKLSDDCDNNTFCVGVIPGGDKQPLIGVTKGVAPECRQWTKGRDSALC
ncbi:hypothetical protein [Pseudonocardia spinosispora]|uniref:hypothetical protein n=1 Tax=Pseudonocardia spinosispora TaxID=103441 RepID=UPI0012EC6996|nr:hypothetical protein [Pseudonocardia spinosispora]